MAHAPDLPSQIATTLEARQRTLDDPVAQRALDADIKNAVSVYGPPHLEGILDMIHAAPVAERRSALFVSGSAGPAVRLIGLAA